MTEAPMQFLLAQHERSIYDQPVIAKIEGRRRV
jgi:hypothetical protein